MPDITGILATFKKELFSGRYMIVIFMWLLILFFFPSVISDSVSLKTGIPYSFQLLAFSISVLLYCFAKFVYSRIKSLRRYKRIAKIQEQRIDEEKNKLENFIRFLDKLPKDELDFLSTVRSSGNRSEWYDSESIPDFISKLVNLNIIYLLNEKDVYGGYYFAITNESLEMFNSCLYQIEKEKLNHYD